MKCKTPIELKREDGGRQLVSCGHCVHCWINRQLGWTLRIVLEAQDTGSSSFITLTYNDEHLTGELDYKDIWRFLKRFRKSIKKPVRYFCVGEYGKRTGREHWHLILFGITPRDAEARVTELWSRNGTSLGYSLVGSTTPNSARYVAKYCLKTGPNGDRFVANMSRRPGIGLAQIERIGKYLAEKLPRTDALPTAWRIGATLHPLDRSSKTALLRGYENAGGLVLNKHSPLTADAEARYFAFVSDPELALQQQALALQHIKLYELKDGF